MTERLYSVKFSLAFADNSKTYLKKELSRHAVLRWRKILMERYGNSLLSFSVYDSNDKYIKTLSY